MSENHELAPTPSQATTTPQLSRARFNIGSFLGAGLVLAAKGKLLLFPLLKILPLIASVYFYSLFFGLPFAALFVALIAIHESGHFFVMKRFKIDASFPMFIPGLGAMIFTKSLYKLSITQQAIVGYAGPAAGTLGAIAFAAYGFANNTPVLLAAAYSGFFLNAFNLLPVPPFDGSHIARLASDKIWTLGIVIFAAMSWYFPAMRNPFVIIIVLLSLPRVLAAWQNRNAGPTVIDATITTRLVFAALYFGLLGVDLAGMLATHFRYE